MKGLGVGVWGLWFRVWGLGSGIMVQGYYPNNEESNGADGGKTKWNLDVLLRRA